MATNIKHRVFISYHHYNDHMYKSELLTLNDLFDIFIDYSIDTGDIDEDLSDEEIRIKIRDEYLRESTVTLLLVGSETRKRKHIDWEIYSSMYDGNINKKSGILVINLPYIGCNYFTAKHSGEKERIYPNIKDWINITERSGYEIRYPYMPDRIIDNLINIDARISVINWNRFIENIDDMRFLIDQTYQDRNDCKYDLSRPMRRGDS